MQIVLNGETAETKATSLSALLAELDLAEAVVATALNGDFVPAGQRAAQPVAAGDRIEIVAPMQGG